jgi:hypothetical protein
MKIFAQDGFGPGDKIEEGLKANVIEGAVLSARYRHPETFSDKTDVLLPHAGELLLDPEFYAMTMIGKTNAKLGSLEEWNYFEAPRRSALITGSEIEPLITKALQDQLQFDHLSSLIAPNIYVEGADTIDAGIALNFIGKAKHVAKKIGVKGKPVYASLVLDRDVLTSGVAFNDLLNALTALTSPPDGFYVLIGSGSVDEEGRRIRSDIYHDHVIAGWMLINYILSINGFKVINGCSDLLSPLLGICGAYAGASGWATSLRQFTMGRYVKPPTQGGSAPLIRYVSNPLLARIKQTDYDNYLSVLPFIKNKLSSDAYYKEETTKSEEALQTWEALAQLCASCVTGSIETDLSAFEDRLKKADKYWSLLADAGLTAGVEAQRDRLEAMQDAITLFRKWAELS